MLPLSINDNFLITSVNEASRLKGTPFITENSLIVFLKPRRMLQIMKKMIIEIYFVKRLPSNNQTYRFGTL